jgi:hypothetical protein
VEVGPSKGSALGAMGQRWGRSKSAADARLCVGPAGVPDCYRVGLALCLADGHIRALIEGNLNERDLSLVVPVSGGFGAWPNSQGSVETGESRRPILAYGDH